MIQFSHTHFTLHGSLFREKLPSDLWILKTWTTLLKGIKVSFRKVKFRQMREEFLKQGDFPECSIVHKTTERMNVLRTTHALTHLCLWQPYEVLLWSRLQWGNWGTASPAPRRRRDWTRQSGSWAILNLPCKPLENILLSIPLQLGWSFVVLQLYPFFLPLVCCRGWKWETPCPDALNSRDSAGLFQGEALMPARCQRQVPAIYSSKGSLRLCRDKQQADSIVTARWTPTGASAHSFTPWSLGTNTFPPLCTSSPSLVENQFPSYDPSLLEICRSMVFFFLKHWLILTPY